MLHKTDAELSAMGWKWCLRDDDGLIAVTTDAEDAANWSLAKRGSVVSLHQMPEHRP